MINLCRLVLGKQTVKNLRRLAYEFELDQSQRKLVAKRNVESLRSLASPLGQGFSILQPLVFPESFSPLRPQHTHIKLTKLYKLKVYKRDLKALVKRDEVQ